MNSFPSQILHTILDILLPPRCLRCGILVKTNSGLCGTCWNKIHFVDIPFCNCCGLPFEVNVGPDTLCGPCLSTTPLFERARSAMIYDKNSRPLLLAFKHGDRTDMTPVLATWMARAGIELLHDADIIVPVPLYWTRLFSRRFNQAALLAWKIAQTHSLVYLPQGLIRVRHTASQGYQSRLSRAHNLRGAIQIRQTDKEKFHNRRVLLIDDVLTTGATVNACAYTLRNAGASAVDVLTIARTIRTKG